MSTRKMISIGMAVVILLSLLVSPASAYRKWRPNPLGPPRWVPADFGHPRKRGTRSVAPKKIETTKVAAARGKTSS